MRWNEVMALPGQTFKNEDEEAKYWLGVLRDGPNYLKFDARLGLAEIFERRKMLAEAAELLESCIVSGVKKPDVFERLARLYEVQGLLAEVAWATPMSSMACSSQVLWFCSGAWQRCSHVTTEDRGVNASDRNRVRLCRTRGRVASR